MRPKNCLSATVLGRFAFPVNQCGGYPSAAKVSTCNNRPPSQIPQLPDLCELGLEGCQCLFQVVMLDLVCGGHLLLMCCQALIHVVNLPTLAGQQLAVLKLGMVQLLLSTADTPFGGLGHIHAQHGGHTNTSSRQGRVRHFMQGLMQSLAQLAHAAVVQRMHENLQHFQAYHIGDKVV